MFWAHLVEKTIYMEASKLEGTENYQHVLFNVVYLLFLLRWKSIVSRASLPSTCTNKLCSFIVTPHVD